MNINNTEISIKGSDSLDANKRLDDSVSIKTKIADAIVFFFKELRIWIVLVLFGFILFWIVSFMGLDDGQASLIAEIPIVLVIFWRYVYRTFKWIYKWVNKNKSR